MILIISERGLGIKHSKGVDHALGYFPGRYPRRIWTSSEPQQAASHQEPSRGAFSSSICPAVNIGVGGILAWYGHTFMADEIARKDRVAAGKPFSVRGCSSRPELGSLRCALHLVTGRAFRTAREDPEALSSFWGALLVTSDRSFRKGTWRSTTRGPSPPDRRSWRSRCHIDPTFGSFRA